MKNKNLIILIILLIWACNNPSNEEIPPQSYMPGIDNSLAGSIAIDAYLVKDGYALYNEREVINTTAPTTAMMLSVDKKGDKAIEMGVVVLWNDTIVNIFSDTIQINGKPGNVTFENVMVDANIRLNDKYETSTITVNGYIKNVDYSRLSLAAPEYDCRINVLSEFDGKSIEVQFNALESSW